LRHLTLPAFGPAARPAYGLSDWLFHFTAFFIKFGKGASEITLSFIRPLAKVAMLACKCPSTLRQAQDIASLFS
jgi:hypothetical protein